MSKPPSQCRHDPTLWELSNMFFTLWGQVPAPQSQLQSWQPARHLQGGPKRSTCKWCLWGPKKMAECEWVTEVSCNPTYRNYNGKFIMIGGAYLVAIPVGCSTLLMLTRGESRFRLGELHSKWAPTRIVWSESLGFSSQLAVLFNQKRAISIRIMMPYKSYRRSKIKFHRRSLFKQTLFLGI